MHFWGIILDHTHILYFKSCICLYEQFWRTKFSDHWSDIDKIFEKPDFWLCRAETWKWQKSLNHGLFVTNKLVLTSMHTNHNTTIQKILSILYQHWFSNFHLESRCITKATRISHHRKTPGKYEASPDFPFNAVWLGDIWSSARAEQHPKWLSPLKALSGTNIKSHELNDHSALNDSQYIANIGRCRKVYHSEQALVGWLNGVNVFWEYVHSNE